MTMKTTTHTAMTASIEATSDPGTRGQQFVAAITGRDRPRFALTFLGRRESGRTVVEATRGLYLCRDVTTSRKVRNGGAPIVAERCIVVWLDEGGAVATEIEEAHALDIAQWLDKGEDPNWDVIGRAAQIARHEGRLSATADKADDAMANVRSQIGSLAPGPATVGVVRAARRAEIARLRGEVASLPVEIDSLPSDPIHRRAKLEAERAQLVARLAEIDLDLSDAAGTMRS